MRKKLLVRNTRAALLTQITSIVCGFILPRFFLKFYGSQTNGLVSSISQFLGIISLLEFGVGAVVQSTLYRPLAEKNNEQISKIVVSANKFFGRLARGLFIYVIVLCILYPFVIDYTFDFVYTTALVLAMSISFFVQYYFGVVDSLLLKADQKGYIQSHTQTITILANTIVCVAMIKMGGSIHLVKLLSALIFLLRPIVLRYVVNKEYDIDREILYKEEPIQQKWNGVAQHIAAVALDNTDIIVLTLFSTLSDVSIYSVYNMVIKGIKACFISTTSGIQALLGELWVRGEMKELNRIFSWIEWCIHTVTVFLFSCTLVLIVPFVCVYTKGILDADYVQPLFAFLLTLAYAVYCIQTPYQIMVLAAGHYKQTQKYFVGASTLNLIISIIMVHMYGVVGVAIGTLVAMIFQLISLSMYDTKKLLRRSFAKIIKQLWVDGLTMVVIFLLGKMICIEITTYLAWGSYAIGVTVIALMVTIAFNLIFYQDKMKKIFYLIFLKQKSKII